MIQINHKQDMLDKVPERFNRQYRNYSSDTSHRITAEQLLLLAKPINAQVVDDLIGNTSWTSFTCDACETEVNVLVYMESKYYDGYEGAYASICKSCLTEMFNLIESSND